MNYLAHSYLAFSEQQLVGQFLEDYIRNNERFSLPKELLHGVKLHREIDTFTDAHDAIHEAKKIFSPLVRLYSGAFVDVAMDYFLANDTKENSVEGWKSHSIYVYSTLEKYKRLFPETFHRMLERMKSDDWLFNYREDWGIKFSMKNVLNKAKYLNPELPVFDVFMENKQLLKECYNQFFPDLKKHVFEVNESFKTADTNNDLDS